MEILLIEVILWGGLAVLFWMLKDKLDGVESEIDPDLLKAVPSQRIPVHFDRAEQLTEPIGTYRDMPIYRHARIAGRDYEFSHVCPLETGVTLTVGQRYLDPGLVYNPC